MAKEKIGRPTKFTPQTIAKLEEAFLLGCSDIEACLFADVSKTALYNYQHANPAFVDRKELLKKSPTFRARRSVINALEDDPDLALKYLERKEKAEFSTREEREVTANFTVKIEGDDSGTL
jgi:hypothetical protein